jgi:hypothetical protein
VWGRLSGLYKLDELVCQFHQIVLDLWFLAASSYFQKSHHYPFQGLAIPLYQPVVGSGLVPASHVILDLRYVDRAFRLGILCAICSCAIVLTCSSNMAGVRNICGTQKVAAALLYRSCFSGPVFDLRCCG